VTGAPPGENLAIRDIEGREQGHGAMPDIVARDASRYPRPSGNTGCVRSSVGILRFLIYAPDHRVVRRIEVEPEDVFTFSTNSGSVRA
jgi:hypothetical protein